MFRGKKQRKRKSNERGRKESEMRHRNLMDVKLVVRRPTFDRTKSTVMRVREKRGNDRKRAWDDDDNDDNVVLERIAMFRRETSLKRRKRKIRRGNRYQARGCWRQRWRSVSSAIDPRNVAK